MRAKSETGVPSHWVSDSLLVAASVRGQAGLGEEEAKHTEFLIVQAHSLLLGVAGRKLSAQRTEARGAQWRRPNSPWCRGQSES